MQNPEAGIVSSLMSFRESEKPHTSNFEARRSWAEDVKGILAMETIQAKAQTRCRVFGKW